MNLLFLQSGLFLNQLPHIELDWPIDSKPRDPNTKIVGHKTIIVYPDGDSDIQLVCRYLENRVEAGNRYKQPQLARL